MFKGMRRAMAMVLAVLVMAGMMTGVQGEGFALKADACSWNGAGLYKKYEAPARTWQPLTDCEKYAASNEEAHFADVKIGNWQSRSGKLEDSIRFCVANKKSYKNTHYIVYDLNGNYTQMTGLPCRVVAEVSQIRSPPGAAAAPGGLFLPCTFFRCFAHLADRSI